MSAGALTRRGPGAHAVGAGGCDDPRVAAVDVRADGADAYLVVVAAGAGEVDALAEPGEEGAGDARVRLVVTEDVLVGLDLLDEDAPQLVRTLADVLAEDGSWRRLPAEVAVGDVLAERPDVRARVQALLAG